MRDRFIASSLSNDLFWRESIAKEPCTRHMLCSKRKGPTKTMRPFLCLNLENMYENVKSLMLACEFARNFLDFVPVIIWNQFVRQRSLALATFHIFPLYSNKWSHCLLEILWLALKLNLKLLSPPCVPEK